MIGPDIDSVQPGAALPLAIWVEAAGERCRPDFEPILERQIHHLVNGAEGIWHMGQRDIVWTRLQGGFSPGSRQQRRTRLQRARAHWRQQMPPYLRSPLSRRQSPRTMQRHLPSGQAGVRASGQVIEMATLGEDGFTSPGAILQAAKDAAAIATNGPGIVSQSPTEQATTAKGTAPAPLPTSTGKIMPIGACRSEKCHPVCTQELIKLHYIRYHRMLQKTSGALAQALLCQRLP